ncbi:MAG: Na+/H+ antiporter NhaC family protein [Oscillospiraceae bacterium]
MFEIGVISLFAISLVLCISFDISILAALVFGFFLFFGYGLLKKHSAKAMAVMAFSGVKTVKNILITFVLIGMITAIWRVCGTIPYIVYHATRFCTPGVMVLVTFLLCCVISALTGTAFGTAATMGVICTTMATSMGVPILYSGGAVLAGSFFGDRCSPMSTSALLVSTLTKTDLYRNITNMVKTSAVPFVISCGIYALLGRGVTADYDVSGVQNLFADAFVLHPAAVIPAAAIIVLSCLKINVKITMSVSILCGMAVAVFVQAADVSQLLKIAVWGYKPEDPQVAALLSGGGIQSMVKVFSIVCLSSCYSGMFNGTGLLEGFRGGLNRLSEKILPFGSILLTSIITVMISCNQALGIMLTHQLCVDTEQDPETLASHLENTVVVVAPLIPWSIAGAVPLASVGAPTACILTACYLYLLPIWNYAVEIRKHCHANP